MIDKLPKNQCTGCKACQNICPKGAISFQIGKDGFWYPTIDENLCIKCNLCEKTCPILTKKDSQKEQPEVKAAWSKDDDVRLASTSGGLFYELATYILEHDGYVAGCVYDDDYKGAHHIIIHDKKDLAPLMVSKYVESDTNSIYRQVRDAVKTNKPVLFVGAPCQCAALSSFMQKDYDNLIIVDFLCRGANSPKAHKRYVEYLESKYGAKITSLRSKDKRYGWEHFGQSATFENGATYFASRNEDLRIVAYHHGNLMMRECCNDCHFKELPRYSDLTLGDFWGITAKEVRDIDKGISLIFINSAKGRKLFDDITPKIEYIDKTLSDAEKGNVAIHTSAPKGKNRDKFLAQLDDMPFDKLVAKYKDKSPNIVVRTLNKVKRHLRRKH